ncbi:hypothetical protein [uncultured Methanolobus sp.]|nr:hypothetical protein [uncultured Methanolobus sp.]
MNTTIFFTAAYSYVVISLQSDLPQVMSNLMNPEEPGKAGGFLQDETK